MLSVPSPASSGSERGDPSVDHPDVERGRRAVAATTCPPRMMRSKLIAVATSVASPRTKAYNTSSATLASAGATDSPGGG